MMILSKYLLPIAALLSSSTILAINAANIVVGDDPDKDDFGWADGVCYLPVKNVRVGDTIKFNFVGHDVYRMHTLAAYSSCDFSPTSATQLASYGKSPFSYTVTAEDAQPLSSELEEGEDLPSFRSLYFSCSIGSHCFGKQRLRVDVDIDYSTTQGGSSDKQQLSQRTEDPVSKFINTDAGTCTLVQVEEADASSEDRIMESTCDEAEKSIDKYGREIFTTSCLGPPTTLTPGGVINESTLLYFPFPADRRVVLGERSFEFVQGDNLEPVNVNQLYVHHILGGLVMGNGAESIRSFDEDAPFPRPYGKLSGDFSDRMTLHLIDLRETGDSWLECLECRCKDIIPGQKDLGGVNCCTNCTDLVGPTIDYRMRYNVSWSEIDDAENVRPVVMVSSDMAFAAGRIVEFDVPMWRDLPKYQRSEDDKTIQVLERTGTFIEIFSDTTFGELGLGDLRDDVEYYEILRCMSHMHIGGLDTWVKNAETGQVYCHNKVEYGDNPVTNEGFISSIGVQDYDPPLLVPANAQVTVTSHYDATVLHTGVMSIVILFLADHDESYVITSEEKGLTVDVCEAPRCDTSIIPADVKLLTEYKSTCRYDSKDCTKMLSNIYTCEKESNSRLDKLASKFEKGTYISLEYAKLGNPSLHGLAESKINELVLPCKPEMFGTVVDKSSSNTNILSSSSVVAAAVVSMTAVSSSIFSF